jgi:hypothetical protein
MAKNQSTMMKCNLVQSQLTNVKKLLEHVLNDEGGLMDVLGELHEVAILTVDDSAWLGVASTPASRLGITSAENASKNTKLVWYRGRGHKSCN